MSTLSRVGRDSLPGGLSKYTERSRSRGDLIEDRGRVYGRGDNSSRFENQEKNNTRGDNRRGEEPEKEMKGSGKYG